MQTIRKDIKFDCCHMLSNYIGKCNNLHGHTYHGSITITSDVDEKTSMVLDYNEIKKVVDAFDHAIIFSAEDKREEAEQALFEWAKKYNKDFLVLEEGKSTAENMSKFLRQRISAVCTLHNCPATNVRVLLSETDGSYAMSETGDDE